MIVGVMQDYNGVEYSNSTLSTTGFFFSELFFPVSLKGRGREKGEKPVGGKVQGRIPRKNTVQSSITSMGFPLLQKPGEMCVGRQIGVSGKF
jgi:hypothetical protein